MDDFKKIALVGTGLMGGSFALAIKERGIQCTVTGFDSDRKALESALRLGIVDRMGKTLEETVTDADLVMLAVPVGHYESIFNALAESLKKGAVVSDLGSVKEAAVTAAERLPEGVSFVGGHPLAGSEKGGVEAASPYLFENAYYFLTPTERTPVEVLDRIKSLVSTIGAFPVLITPQKHDYIVARTSHLPHFVASVLACTMDEENDEELKNFTGSGFRDTTRIAAGNPVMWEEIFFYNQRELLDGVEKLENMLRGFRQSIALKKRIEVRDLLEKGKKYRDTLPQAGKDYLPEWYQIYVDIKDEPGALARITSIIGQAEVNIKEIEILHAREGEKGAVRLAFAEAEEERRAMKALGEKGLSFTRKKGEMNHADRT
ncbi:MAG: prephenate dehydrogenase [Tindallia sp. MSAO_Bac2]|nr:MAG: prephenate dehydrogenase [Tindallia sp. MSAO_Bac2]